MTTRKLSQVHEVTDRYEQPKMKVHNEQRFIEIIFSIGHWLSFCILNFVGSPS